MIKRVLMALVLAAQIAATASSAPEWQTNSAKFVLRNGNRVTCSVPAGETIFVVALPQTADLDQLTVVNENWVARGKLQIAIASESLPPGSAKWRTVEGTIPFNHKRVFSVCLLGTEAKYVRLSFQVDSERSHSSQRES